MAELLWPHAAGANSPNGAGGHGGAITVALGSPRQADIFGYNVSAVFNSAGGRGAYQTKAGSGGQGGGSCSSSTFLKARESRHKVETSILTALCLQAKQGALPAVHSLCIFRNIVFG